MGVRLTTEAAIAKARALHGDKYDYSSTVYSGMNNTIVYRCQKHGLITQKAQYHLINGNGCPYCAKERKFLPRTTKERFLAESLKAHGDKYDYSKVDYQGVDKKVCIVCPVHGEFWQTPWNHINFHNGCPSCAQNRRLTLELFLEAARKKHGDKYDYSSVHIDTVRKPVLIKCPIHGGFYQSPGSHMIGCGCPKCAHRENDGKVRGKGIKPKYISSKRENKRAYSVWVNMLERTTPGSIFQQRFPTYVGCTCSDEWLSFENFLEWYKSNGGIDNPTFVLDKDILFKGNKLYSKETCCLVPPQINRLVIIPKQREYPLGVTRKGEKYLAQIVERGQKVGLGTYDTKEEAHEVYISHKRKEIARVAAQFYDQGHISKRVYDALINFSFNSDKN